MTFTPSLSQSRPRRTVYVLRDSENRCLIDTQSRNGPMFSDSPVVALRHNMAWLSKEVAFDRLKAYAVNCKKGPPVRVDAVEMILASSGWEVAP
jgi:hypothetical protein